MGWTYSNKGSLNTKEFFEKEFNHNNSETGISGKVLACSTSNGVSYIAYEYITPNERKVSAIVCLLHRESNNPHGCNFGYKDITEDMGPVENKCPEKVLKLLTPTDNRLANSWRQSCWNRVNRLKSMPKVKTGNTVKFNEPIHFKSGKVLDTFQYIKGSTFSNGPYSSLYRISNWKERLYQVVKP